MILVNTQTYEDYVKIIDLLLEKGMRWNNGSRFNHEEYWDEHKSEMCIMIKETRALMYCSKTYAINHYKEEILDPWQFFEKNRNGLNLS